VIYIIGFFNFYNINKGGKMSSGDEIDVLRAKLLKLLISYPTLDSFFKKSIIEETNIDRLKSTQSILTNSITRIESNKQGGYRNLNMNLKDVKELCKAHQIKLSRVVNDKRVAYTKKELITKLKRKKLL
jgi:hypothetical protein